LLETAEGRVLLHYDTSGHLALSDAPLRYVDQALDALHQIPALLLAAEDCLLRADAFALRAELIFIDGGTGAARLIYGAGGRAAADRAVAGAERSGGAAESEGAAAGAEGVAAGTEDVAPRARRVEAGRNPSFWEAYGELLFTMRRWEHITGLPAAARQIETRIRRENPDLRALLRLVEGVRKEWNAILPR
jgi:hypothetical protein